MAGPEVRHREHPIPCPVTLPQGGVCNRFFPRKENFLKHFRESHLGTTLELVFVIRNAIRPHSIMPRWATYFPVSLLRAPISLFQGESKLLLRYFAKTTGHSLLFRVGTGYVPHVCRLADKYPFPSTCDVGSRGLSCPTVVHVGST